MMHHYIVQELTFYVHSAHVTKKQCCWRCFEKKPENRTCYRRVLNNRLLILIGWIGCHIWCRIGCWESDIRNQDVKNWDTENWEMAYWDRKKVGHQKSGRQKLANLKSGHGKSVHRSGIRSWIRSHVGEYPCPQMSLFRHVSYWDTKNWDMVYWDRKIGT